MLFRSFKKTVKSKEFIIVDGVVALSENDISIDAKGSKLIFANELSTIAVDMLETEVKGISADKSNSKYSLEISRDALLEILKISICYIDDNLWPNVVLHVKEQSITATGTNGNAIAYAKAECTVQPGAKWDDACAAYVASIKSNAPTQNDMPGCDTAIPATFITYLISALTLSNASSVNLIVDNKYLHLRYDANSIISVRLSSKIPPVNSFWSIAETPPEECFAVEKSRFEAAVKLIRKRLDINKAVGANVGIHLTTHKKAFEISVADNNVQVPIVESSAHPSYDKYVAPAYLESAISACKAGNILIKITPGYEKFFICANGTVKDGFTPKAPRILFAMLNPDTAKQSEARFASGKEIEKKDAKEEKK